MFWKAHNSRIGICGIDTGTDNRCFRRTREVQRLCIADVFPGDIHLQSDGALDFAGGLVIHILSGVSSLTICILLGKRRGYGKPTILGAVFGAVAGLVAITPAASYVTVLPSIAIGLIGGILGCNGCKSRRRKRSLR